jgi:hypothetical protein
MFIRIFMHATPVHCCLQHARGEQSSGKGRHCSVFDQGFMSQIIVSMMLSVAFEQFKRETAAGVRLWGVIAQTGRAM